MKYEKIHKELVWTLKITEEIYIMGKIFYIMGKSASGKDHIYKHLMKTKELDLKNMVLYTTRPIRAEEENGKQYFFVNEEKLHEFEAQGRLIESRSYNTVHGIWTYFTADDGQVKLEEANYLGIGTLESFQNLVKYYGEENVIPIYIEVESGERLFRALSRERAEISPKYAEMCRRFLADEEDFSEEKIQAAGVKRRFENINLGNCVEEITQYIKSLE